MKYSNYKVLFLILLLAQVFCSCSSSVSGDLMGKWKVKSFEISPPSEESSFLEKELESMIFDFKDDGLLLHSNFFRTGALGTWNLTKSEDSIICSYMYERATYVDKFALKTENGFTILNSSDFETTDEVILFLEKQ